MMTDACYSTDLTKASAQWRIENGDYELSADVSSDLEVPAVENPEQCVLWYFNYFLGKKHQNYLGVDETGEVFGASVLKEETPHGEPSYKTIVWTSNGIERQMVQAKHRQTLSAIELVRRAAPKLQLKKLKEVDNSDILTDFKELEATQTELSYKFGVLLAKPGQSNEDEFYENLEGSAKYKEFLNLLGDHMAAKRRSQTLTNVARGKELKEKEIVRLSSTKDNLRSPSVLPIFETEILFTKPFSERINCVDVVESDESNCVLIFATDEAIYLYKSGSENQLQLNVLLVLTPKGLHVFEMDYIRSYCALKAGQNSRPVSGSFGKMEEPRGKRLDQSKGCTVFGYSKNSLGEVQDAITLLYIAIKKTLILYEWSRGEFHRSREFTIHDPIKTLCTLAPGMVCVGIAKEFLLVDMFTSTYKELYKKPDSEPVKALSLDTEILLCFNNIGLFVDEKGIKTRPYEIKWGSIPSSLVLLPNYVLGISGPLIEVRTLLNGNIIQSLLTSIGSPHHSESPHNGTPPSHGSDHSLSSYFSNSQGSQVAFTTFNDMAHVDNGNIYVASSFKGTSCIIRIRQTAQPLFLSPPGSPPSQHLTPPTDISNISPIGRV
eukprot:gene12298-14418_t